MTESERFEASIAVAEEERAELAHKRETEGLTPEEERRITALDAELDSLKKNRALMAKRDEARDER